jgi:hypothetical protein
MYHVRKNEVQNMKIIGIDPDNTLNGVAEIENSKIKVFKNMNFFELQDYLVKQDKENTVVVIEQGEQNKALYNAKGKLSIALSVAKDVGKNFMITDLIIQFCKHIKLNYQTYMPRCHKWNHQFVVRLGCVEKRTNQEQRDAIRAALSHTKIKQKSWKN